MACQVTSALDFNKRLCKTDLSGLKLSVNIANPGSKLLCTEVRQCNTVQVCKLTDIVTSLDSELVSCLKTYSQ